MISWIKTEEVLEGIESPGNPVVDVASHRIKTEEVLEGIERRSILAHTSSTTWIKTEEVLEGLHPTATLLEHMLLTQGWTGTSKASFPRRLRPQNRAFAPGQIWATHESDVVGIPFRLLSNGAYPPWRGTYSRATSSWFSE